MNFTTMGPNDGSKGFVVEEPNPNVYNMTRAEPPVWEPPPEDILTMFQQLETEKVLPLKWVCPGRRPPEKEPAEQEAEPPSEDEDDDFDRMEEKRAPEPSAFDFDDTASEGSTRIMPRTPVSAKKRPEKKVASMNSVLSSIRRQQKAEREARKSFPRGQGASPFRGGTPSRMAGFSPGSSPVSSRFAAAGNSPRPGGPTSPRLSGPPESPSARLGHPASSPLSRPVGSPSASRLSGYSGSPPTSKPASRAGSPRQAGSPSAARGMMGGGATAQSAASPKGPGSPAVASGNFTAVTATTGDSSTVNQQGPHTSVASTVAGTSSVDPSAAQTVSTSVSGTGGVGDACAKPGPVPIETGPSNTEEPKKS